MRIGRLNVKVEVEPKLPTAIEMSIKELKRTENATLLELEELERARKLYRCQIKRMC